jgi:polysaccharide export outer membrane protein
MSRRYSPLALLAALLALALSTPRAMSAEPEPYQIQAGDILIVSVWKETDLTSEVLVRPDGGISFPLVGGLQAAGRNIDELRTAMEEKLRKFIPDPAVTIAVKQIGGNRIYVLGKVNRPGEFAFSQSIDVMQALSLAGGTTAYAELDDIRILRRAQGHQIALRFKYGEVEKGHSLEQNILLKSGDTVVVP